MAQTGRQLFTGSAPSTEYHQGADIIAQSQAGNYSIVRMSITAFNVGSTGSFSNDNGAHTGAIDGYAPQNQRAGTLPSGYPFGAVRWDQYVDITIAHDAAGNRGNVTLRQTVSGWHPTDVRTVAFGGFPRIPKKPSAPGTPVASEVLPTSLRLTWTASSDNGGSTIVGYLVRRWDNPEGTGTPVDDYVASTALTRVMSGLTPGKEYRWAVYARNGSHDQYSVASTAIVVRTLSGMWLKVSGTWRRVAVWVKSSGTWKAAATFIKHSGSWKRGG